MKYECVYSEDGAGWAVEATGQDGEPYIALFIGWDDEARARAYAAEMNKINDQRESEPSLAAV